MKKITDIMLTVFGIGILVCLLAGALSFAAYIVAMCIGGETATKICEFVFKTYLPWVIKITSIFTAIGLIAMYLSKKKALVVSEKKEKEDVESGEINFEKN